MRCHRNIRVTGVGRNSGSARIRPPIPGRGTIRPICQIAVAVALDCVVDFGDLVEVSMNLGGRDRVGVVGDHDGLIGDGRAAGSAADPTTARRLVTRTPACRFAGGSPPHPDLNAVGEGGGEVACARRTARTALTAGTSPAPSGSRSGASASR